MKTVPVLLIGLAALLVAASAPTPPDQKTTLESAHAEFWTVGNETHFVFDGTQAKRVTLVGTDLKIVCDHLEITALGVGARPNAKAKEDPNATIPAVEKFKYLLATGHVNIVQGEREANCGRAEVFPRENKIELTEKPVVLDHSNGWTGAGKKITMFRGERRVVIEDTEFEGPSIKNLGFDPSQPAPGAGATKPASPESVPPTK
jgi:lipopolysaccharide export system protein LptA